jgi:hypothetical protein
LLQNSDHGQIPSPSFLTLVNPSRLSHAEVGSAASRCRTLKQDKPAQGESGIGTSVPAPTQTGSKPDIVIVSFKGEEDSSYASFFSMARET